MSPLPYLPAGVASLPAERFVLFADTDHQVMRVDESTLQKDGADFTAYWESPPLAPHPGHSVSLMRVELFYSVATPTFVRVRASNDGGDTWQKSQSINLDQVNKRIARGVADFFPGVTGEDVRIRIELPTDIPVNIYGYKPHLVDRGMKV